MKEMHRNPDVSEDEGSTIDDDSDQEEDAMDYEDRASILNENASET